MGIEAVGHPLPSSSFLEDRADHQKRQLHEAAQEFEAIFLSYLLKALRRSLGKGGLFQGGLAQDVYEALFDTELARILAKAGGIGLGSFLERQLLKTLPLEGEFKNSRNLPIGVHRTTPTGGIDHVQEGADR